MTGSARRLPSGRRPVPGHTPIRLSPRTRAVLGARRAGLRSRPQRLPFLRILFAVVLTGILGMGAVGSVGFLAASGAVAALSAQLPDPAQLESLTFSQPTIIYDRTGKIELARFVQLTGWHFAAASL